MLFNRPKNWSLLFLVAFWILPSREFAHGQGEKYSLIEKGLYMGGYVKVPPRGARAVLNLCEVEDPYRVDHQLWEPIKDTEPAPSLAWLRKMLKFIDEHRGADRITYVHCRNGASRSGFVIVAYVMQKNRWPRDKALAYVRSKRPETRPNPAFMERLLEWERELKIEPAKK